DQDTLNADTVTAQTTLASDQQAVQTAQQNLDDTTLSAPMSGTVLTLNGQVGDSVSAGSGGSGASSSSAASSSNSSSNASSGNSGGGTTGGGSGSSGGSGGSGGSGSSSSAF